MTRREIRLLAFFMVLAMLAWTVTQSVTCDVTGGCEGVYGR